MNLQEIIQQYRGATLPKLVEKQIKSLNEATLQQAIRGTYDNFPVEFRPQVDVFTLAYAEKWFGPHIIAMDLGDVLSTAIQDIKIRSCRYLVTNLWRSCHKLTRLRDS